MILNLYDLEHKKIAGLKNFKDASIESVLSMGDKTLSFSWHSKNSQKIPLESYIRTDTDEYVVKENSKGSNGYRKIVAKLNLEEVESMLWEVFQGEELSAKEMADYALSDTGWSCISYIDESKKRNISLKKVSSYSVFEKIADAFTCEVAWDSIHKIVYLKEKVGDDKGAYFLKGLNLIDISDSCDSYDFATRLIPIGADDLYITEINDGKKYLENYQYASKVKTVIWEDSNYTDAQALKEDAEYKLNEISKPKRTYQAKVCDLAKMKPEYSVLEYRVGDIVTLIDNESGIREQQRITKTVEYIGNPQKNTCDISNTVLSFEDMQKQLFAAAECISNITTDNGTIKGSTVDSIDVTQIIGLERYISEDMNELRVNHLYVTTELGTPLATIGKIVSTNADITNLNVLNRADIELEYVKESHVTDLYADNLKVSVIEADNLSAVFEIVEHLETEYAKINFENVNVASINKGFLNELMVSQGIITDRVTADGIAVTGCLTGIKIFANDIVAGTIDAGMIKVVNLDCANLTVGQINGKQIASGAIDFDKLDNTMANRVVQTEEDIIEALSEAGMAKSSADEAGKAALRAEEKIENLEIGARNLLRHSKTLIYEKYYIAEGVLLCDENGELILDDEGEKISA